jgi:PilZ domain
MTTTAEGTTEYVPDRRRHSRFPLGLPVIVHLAGRADPVTVELVDVSAGGGRFRFASADLRLDQHATFGFVVPDQRRCSARGRIVRVDEPGQFAVSLEQANEAFLGFLGLLGG